MAHPYTPYCPCFDYIGRHSYLLTFVTFVRNVIFTDVAPVNLVWAPILRASAEKQFEVLVYMFMPDHAHLVVVGQADDSDLKAFAKLAKQYSGYYYVRAYPGRKLWQHGGNDHIVRNDVERLDKIRYVLNNPVAAGLVTKLEDYSFFGSQRWTREELIALLEPQERSP
jgi:putative transposase